MAVVLIRGIEDTVRERLEASTALHAALVRQSGAVARAAQLMIAAYRSGHKALFFGNGGSAADAQHLAAELVGRFYRERRALPAIALTGNASSVTALGNDYGYERVFARQVEALGAPGDVAVGISTSGSSANVLAGIEAAHAMGLHTVGLTGMGGGRLAELAEACVMVPSVDVPRVQEGHILIGHVLCELVEDAICGEPGSQAQDG